MQITENFKMSEFSVSRSSPRLVEPVPAYLYGNVFVLAEHILQPLRNKFGSIRITSGYRGEALNNAVNGSPTSQHKAAQAADISNGMIRNLFEFLVTNDLKFGGQMIYYPHQSFVHVAIASPRHPRQICQITFPTLGLSNRTVRSVAELEQLLPKWRDQNV